jgi:hypothetical protein
LKGCDLVIKSRLYAKAKVGRMPKIMSLSDAEISKLLQNIEIEPDDIQNFLEGHDLGLLGMDDIEACAIDVIFQGLKQHRENIKEHGQDNNVLAWQRNGGFNYDENPAAMMVVGFEVDFRKVRTMDEKILQEWLIKYLKMLASEQHH